MTDLFTPSLISPSVTQSLKPGFVVRPLRSDDYDKGFLECLAMLTTTGKMPKKDFLGKFELTADRFQYLHAHNHEYSFIYFDILLL
jgi:glucosamine-phosphate N-acetyltransferase